MLDQQYNLSGDEQKLAIIAQALQSSKILQLNSEETGVKRKTKFVGHNNVDERTIYVENLPSEVDNELLYAIFKKVIINLYFRLEA